VKIQTKIYKSFLKNLYRSSLLSRKNDLAYRIAIIFFIFALPYVPVFWVLDLYFSTWIVIATIVMFFFSILLNKLKWFNLSKLFLIVGPAGSFFSCANILTSSSGAQLLLFTLIPLPLLLFEITQIIWIVISMLIPICLYVSLELGNYNWILFREIIPNHTMLTIRVSAIVTTFILIALSTVTYFVSNRRYELKIEEKNDKLKGRNLELLGKNSQIQEHLNSLEKAYYELENKKKLENEFELAKLQQQEFLPVQMASVDGYLFDSYFKGARGVSGDFYDYKCFGDTTKCIVADVRSKSISAGFITVHLYSMFRTTVTNISTTPQLLSTINNVLVDGRNSYEKAAAFAFNINSQTHMMTYSNAGIGLALHVREKRIESLDNGGFMVGGDKNEVYGEYSLSMEPGDIFLVASDGLEDVRNKDQELFGRDRVYAVIRDYLVARDLDADESDSLKIRFERALQDFQDEDSLPVDDVVIIVLERIPNKVAV
jgi:serine phosphatase RsbU (regulator of sigma subunit)